MEATNIIRQDDGYLHGIVAADVEQKGSVLVFRGEFFLDSEGLPTSKTTAAFNMFKQLAQVLTEKYHLAD